MKHRNTFLFLAFATLFLYFGKANAQTSKTDSIVDKSKVYLLSPSHGFVLIDTAFENTLTNVHRVDKANQISGGYYQQLSTPGSPGQDLIFSFENQNSRTYLPNLFTPYTYTAENIKYYQVTKPHSNLRYSNDINSSQYFTIFHTQNIVRKWNIGLTYDVNYADGTFAKSNVMNQYFNITSNYESENGRYKAAASFIRNRAYVLENGGLESDSIFLNQLFSKPETYPTNLYNAYSKYKTADFSLYQSFDFNKTQEERTKILNKGVLSYKIDFKQSARLYKDDFLTTPDSFATRLIENTLSWKNDILGNNLLPLHIGLKHEMLKFSDSIFTANYSILTPHFSIGFHSKQVHVSLYANESFRNRINENGENIELEPNSFFETEYELGASADLFFGKNRFIFNASNQKQNNIYFFSHFANSNIALDKLSEQTKQSSLNITYRYDDIIQLNLNYFQQNNRPKIDSRDLKISYSDIINIYQAKLILKKEWKHFGLENNYVLQQNDNQEYLHLPAFLAKQSIYVKFDLFKGKLETIVGLDLKYNTSYYADIYLPQLGVFTYQNEKMYGNYVYCDLFVNARIDKCNVFLALTHPYAGLFGYNYISTPLYPNEGLSFRWGLSWNFVN